FGKCSWRIYSRCQVERITVETKQRPKFGITDAHRVLQHGLEHRLQIARGRTDDAQHLPCSLLPLQRLVAFAGKTRSLRFLGAGRTATGRRLGWNGALWHFCLTAARSSLFAAFSRAPFHRLPRGFELHAARL